eukprot:2740141-Pleurochrysis_carterae.AAC.2
MPRNSVAINVGLRLGASRGYGLCLRRVVEAGQVGGKDVIPVKDDVSAIREHWQVTWAETSRTE